MKLKLKKETKQLPALTAPLRLCSLLLLLAAYCLPLAAQTRDYTRHVNPFIGTGGHGHTFPGATMPFGMVQLSPDTRIDNWDGSSGYHYSDDIIYGFSHTHLSGTGIPDYCDILFMPTVGEPQFFAKEGDKSVNGYASKFSHANEKAEPGYYSVKLDDDGILAEMTATKRVGVHRYTFPRTKNANLNLDLGWRDKVLGSEVHITSINGKPIDQQVELPKRFKSAVKIEGYRRSSSWAKNQVIFFVAELSKNFGTLIPNQTGNENAVRDRTDLMAVKGNNVNIALTFDTSDGAPVILKVAISSVSIEGARKNLAAELPHWDFEKVRSDAKAAWNKELSKIDVLGGSPDQTTTFYTALYHTMIQPNIFNDVDGSYLGMDKKVHQLPGYLNRRDAETHRGKEVKESGLKNSASLLLSGEKSEQYTVFSLWDTFRAAHPLYTIIDQNRTVDFINTFIRQYEQGRRLPVWELAGEETDTMIGYHAVSVIADAMAKGIKGFDYEKAYKAAKHSAELDHFGLAGYKKRGYISMEDENESVSRTLEYAYNDWCIAQMASEMTSGRNKELSALYRFNNPVDPKVADYSRDQQAFQWRARYFENLFDAKTGFFRAKKNGGFVEPFDPTEVNFGFTEGNSWQYSFFVPHDIEKLVELMGGKQKFIAKLDELFTTEQKLSGREQADLTGLIGQYAHGNEPSHHIAYLYNYVGEPWKTQKYVRKIMDEFYRNAPDGLIGNEDCGQMSAWYILSAAGFYQVNPGDGMYTLGTPLFPEVKFKLENGKTFTVRAKGLSPKNTYVASASVNGQPHYQPFLFHDTIMSGKVLEFTMTDAPQRQAFRDFRLSAYPATVAVPSISAERTFADRTSVTVSTVTPNVKIHITVDGSEPTRRSPVYVEPIIIDRTTTLRALAISENGPTSFPVEAVLSRRPNDWTVRVVSPYSTQYTGGGDQAIIDGIRGTVNFASGEWQGVQGKTYEAVVDLQRETAIKELGGSFLQVAGPWIWMPDRVEFETSSDGVNFVKAAEIKPGFSQTDLTPTAREYVQKITPTKARYVRIRAYNFGKIPSWHLGAGGDPWIFVDEIIVR